MLAAVVSKKQTDSSAKTPSELSGELLSELVLLQVFGHTNHLHEDDFGQVEWTHEPL
jgi:hypothetical protein